MKPVETPEAFVNELLALTREIERFARCGTVSGVWSSLLRRRRLIERMRPIIIRPLPHSVAVELRRAQAKLDQALCDLGVEIQQQQQRCSYLRRQQQRYRGQGRGVPRMLSRSA